MEEGDGGAGAEEGFALGKEIFEWEWSDWELVEGCGLFQSGGWSLEQKLIAALGLQETGKRLRMLRRWS